MRLTLLAVATETGLGYQTKSYFKHLKPNKTVVIDISSLNGKKQHYEWYPGATIYKGIPNGRQIREILEDTDVLFTAETVYNLDLYRMARELGVKTICVENPEFYDHIKYPDYQLPDLIILPSIWLENEIRQHATSRGAKVIQIHHPVDRQVFPFRQRTTNKPIHIAGYPAAEDRNGTWDYMGAVPNGRVITQSDDLAHLIRRRYRMSDVRTDIHDPKHIYDMGDILVLPRKYGGNCLPLNEALSCGMPVIMPDIAPNNNILPKEWLCKANKAGYFEPRGRIDLYESDINSLVETIEHVKNNIEEYSKMANEIADTISWETLRPKYTEAIESVL